MEQSATAARTTTASRRGDSMGTAFSGDDGRRKIALPSRRVNKGSAECRRGRLPDLHDPPVVLNPLLVRAPGAGEEHKLDAMGGCRVELPQRLPKIPRAIPAQ